MAVDKAKLKAQGFMPQIQKNNFSMRLHSVGGTVTTSQVRAAAEIADKYGEGYLHLTARQGIEIPFIKYENIEEIKTELSRNGLELGSSGPRVRSVTACQGGECCPFGCFNVLRVAKEFDRRYFGKPLPHKFKFGLTGCPNNCLKAEENDFGVKGVMSVRWKDEKCIRCGACTRVCRYNAIRLEDNKIIIDYDKCKSCGACARICPTDAIKGEKGYEVSFGGTFGNSIQKGEHILPIIRDDKTLFAVADAALRFFEENAKPKERLYKVIDRVGREKFEAQMKEALRGDSNPGTGRHNA